MLSFLKYVKWWGKREEQKLLQSMAIGMNSSVDVVHDVHVIMLDYDGVSIEDVQESVVDLQEFWYLSDAFIFKTRHGFHVFMWYDQVPYERLRMIIDYAKYVDPMFKYIGRFYNHKTIRVAGKYKEQDIVFVERVSGIRVPSDVEMEIGELKRAEHALLIGVGNGQKQ